MRCASTVIAERGARRTARRARVYLGLAAALLSGACGRFRGFEGDLPPCDDYEAVVQPLLSQRCVSCHGPDRSEGHYRLTSRLDALARGDDGALRVSVPDGGSEAPVLAAARGALPGHEALAAEEQAVVRRWIVDCKAGGRRLAFHPRGWSTPSSGSFHGDALRKSGYQLDAGTLNCQECHGDDLAGGKAQVACRECHQHGLFTCDMCHGTSDTGAPPPDLSGSKLTSARGVGAHQTHLRDGPQHRAYDCSACHVKPQTPFQAGHFLIVDPATGALSPDPDGRAEVVFKLDGGGGSYSYDETRCADTACHAPVKDAAATNQRPTWTKVGQGEAACGTCHGVPPANHSSEPECGLCHPGAFSNGFLDGGLRASTHADGVVNVGGTDGPLTCTSCHGDATAFHDLHGQTSPSLLTVGAHQAHLDARHHLSAPIGCAECHAVPAEVRSPGHLDAPLPAVVFPAAARGLAWQGGAVPTWSRETGTCTNVYCHSLGTQGALDRAPGLVPAVTWTKGSSQAVCGACHGVPPTTASHRDAGVTSLFECAQCHGDTMDGTGGIKVSRAADGGLRTTHLDGILNVTH